jgi:signal transduction histidine kinase
MIRGGLNGDDRELISKGWRLVEKNQSRIETLIKDMLSYSKDREPMKEPSDLGEVVRDIIELVSGQATARGTTIVADLPDELPTANIDSEAMHAAILNVIGNAIDAVENGTIQVTLRFEGRHILTVDDNGPGIPPEQREAVFEPFVSSKGVRGTGLGLPVSRKTCREHGGELTIEDSPLGGARFVFTI